LARKQKIKKICTLFVPNKYHLIDFKIFIFSALESKSIEILTDIPWSKDKVENKCNVFTGINVTFYIFVNESLNHESS